MGRRPYKICKNNPTVPTCWQPGENIDTQNHRITECPLDPLQESIDHSDFPLDNEVESDHLSSGSGTSTMSLDDQSSVTSSTTSNSSSANCSTPDPYGVLLNPHCHLDLDHFYSFHDTVEMVDEEEDPNKDKATNNFLFPPSQNDSGFVPGPSLCLWIELLNLCSCQSSS